MQTIEVDFPIERVNELGRIESYRKNVYRPPLLSPQMVGKAFGISFPLKGAGQRLNIKKTTVELTKEQYFFLKEKALGLQKQNQNVSVVSIIRALVEKDRQQWYNEKHQRGKESNEQQ